MVETKGYTLEEIATAFEGSTANLIPIEPYLGGSDAASQKCRDIEGAK